MSSFSEIRSIEIVPSSCIDQVLDINTSSSENTLKTSSTISEMSQKPSLMVLLAGIMLKLFFFITEATKVTGLLLLLPFFGIIMGTSEMKHRPHAWAISVTALSAYSIGIFMVLRKTLLFFWHIARLIGGIYAYHSNYVMSVLDLDDSNPVLIGCYRKRGGFGDPHPETLSLSGFIHHQGCMGRYDGTYDQDERFLKLLKLILLALSLAVASLYLPAIIRLLGSIVTSGNRSNEAQLHSNEVDLAYQNGLKAGQKLIERELQALKSKLGFAEDHVAMCNVHHKTEHRLAMQLMGLQHQAEVQKGLLTRKSFDYDRLIREWNALTKDYEAIKMSEPAQLLKKLSDKDIEISDLERIIEKLKTSDSAKELRDAEKKWVAKLQAAEQKWKVKIENQETRHSLAQKALEEKLEEQLKALQSERELSKSNLAQANFDKSLASANLQDALSQVASLRVVASQQTASIHQHEEAMVSARAEAGRFMEAFKSEAASKQALMDNVLELEKKIADLVKTVQTQENKINADAEERAVLWNRHKDSLQSWQKERKGLKDAHNELSKELSNVKGNWEDTHQHLENSRREANGLRYECARLDVECKHFRGQNNGNLAAIAKMSQEIRALKKESLKSSTPGSASAPAPTSAPAPASGSASSSAPTPVSSLAPVPAAQPSLPAAPAVPVAAAAAASPASAPKGHTAQQDIEQKWVDEQLALMKSMSFDD